MMAILSHPAAAKALATAAPIPILEKQKMSGTVDQDCLRIQDNKFIPVPPAPVTTATPGNKDLKRVMMHFLQSCRINREVLMTSPLLVLESDY